MDGGADLSGQLDDGGNPLDLTQGDMTCVPLKFPGFGGFSATERRYDCPCGCPIDDFTGMQLSPIWNVASPATFTPSNMGLGMAITKSGGTAAFGAITSLQTGNSFYLDGDFDLLVDWEIMGGATRDGHVLVTLDNSQVVPNARYDVQRERTAADVDQYSSMLGGVMAVKVPTTDTSGTFELKRTGFTVQAFAGGAQVTQFLGGSRTRLAILLSLAIDTGCNGTCNLAVRWKNLRLAYGSLVDRR
jgi:hypothetical protein